ELCGGGTVGAGPGVLQPPIWRGASPTETPGEQARPDGWMSWPACRAGRLTARRADCAFPAALPWLGAPAHWPGAPVPCCGATGGPAVHAVSSTALMPADTLNNLMTASLAGSVKAWTLQRPQPFP